MASTTPPSPSALTPTSDEDLDGIPALLEFAMGLSEDEHNGDSALVESITETPDGSFFTISYQRSRMATESLALRVTRSTSLEEGSWSDTGILWLETNDIDQDLELVTERSIHSIEDPEFSQEFLRLEVSQKQ